MIARKLTSTSTIGDLARGRRNNFDFLRFLLATSVVFSHSFAFMYNPTWYGYDPLLHLTNGQAGFGGSAVDGFFLISGFLVTQSWENTRDLAAFAAKRALRILPGLAVVLLFCVFVVGPLAVTDRAAYFRDPGVYRYLGLMFAKRIDPSDMIPGVFLHNPEPGSMNGSLWTIRYELGCYVLVAAAGLWGLRRKPSVVALVCAIAFLLKGVTIIGHHSFGEWDNLFHLVTYFTVGMLFYIHRDRIPMSRALFAVSLVGLVISCVAGFLAMAMPIFFAYALFYIAFSPRIPLHHFAKHGDLSYGLYLYACPVQQLLVTYFVKDLNAYTLFALAMAVTSVCAAASWRFVEQPALRLKPGRRPVPKSAPSAPDLEPAALEVAG